MAGGTSAPVVVAVVAGTAVSTVGAVLYLGRWAGRIETCVQALAEKLTDKFDGLDERVRELEKEQHRWRRGVSEDH
jgi:hypothetical protein